MQRLNRSIFCCSEINFLENSFVQLSQMLLLLLPHLLGTKEALVEASFGGKLLLLLRLLIDQRRRGFY